MVRLFGFCRNAALFQPSPGEIMGGGEQEAQGPAHAVAPEHDLGAEVVGEEVDGGKPQQDQGENGVDHGKHAVACTPHGVVLYSYASYRFHGAAGAT